MNALEFWDETDEDGRLGICKLLSWPAQYAEGPATEEWLTGDQVTQLKETGVNVVWDSVDQVLKLI